MTVATALALLSEIVTNLPAAISTGQQVIQLVNDGYRRLTDAAVESDTTPEQINELVRKIVANSAAIEAID